MNDKIRFKFILNLLNQIKEINKECCNCETVDYTINRLIEYLKVILKESLTLEDFLKSLDVKEKKIKEDESLEKIFKHYEDKKKS